MFFSADLVRGIGRVAQVVVVRAAAVFCPRHDLLISAGWLEKDVSNSLGFSTA